MTGSKNDFIYDFDEDDLDCITINPHLLEKVPEAFAQKSTALLISCEANELQIVTYPRPDHELDELREALRFAIEMDVSIRFSFAEKYILDHTIERLYKTAAAIIENCDLKFQFRCPKRWLDLSPTDHETRRFCSVCQRAVYLCDNEYEAKTLGKEGKCIAVIDLKYPSGYLIGSLIPDDDYGY
ncbi:GspE/PulE/PilB domain-containing protein [Lacunimicrobium album]